MEPSGTNSSPESSGIDSVIETTELPRGMEPLGSLIVSTLSQSTQ